MYTSESSDSPAGKRSSHSQPGAQTRCVRKTKEAKQPARHVSKKTTKAGSGKVKSDFEDTRAIINQLSKKYKVIACRMAKSQLYRKYVVHLTTYHMIFVKVHSELYLVSLNFCLYELAI